MATRRTSTLPWPRGAGEIGYSPRGGFPQVGAGPPSLHLRVSATRRLRHLLTNRLWLRLRGCLRECEATSTDRLEQRAETRCRACLVPMDPTDHVTVAAALGRLGRQGGWDRLRAGMPLSSVDLIDAELLLAAGLLSRSGTDTFAVAEPDLAVIDGDVLADGVRAQPRRAQEHMDRRVGWSGADPELVMSQGRSRRPRGTPETRGGRAGEAPAH